jgi:ribosomal-protein-alanine N-acetyltransferase
MLAGVEIETPRLWLRRWRTEDLEPFAALNADPEVMEHFPAILSRQGTAELVNHAEKHFANHGFGPWAVEVPGQAPFIGYIGLAVPAFEASFMPCVEIGWRLAARDRA